MTTPGGVIQALSASQAEEFDPEQVGGCPRRWYYHRVARLPAPESGAAREDGDAGHALFAMHYRGQPLPKRARMLKAVRGAISKGELPSPAPDQLVESRFDGQPTAARLPLRTSTTLWLGAMPWDGYVDLRFYRSGTITVLDHKFSSDIHTYAKSDLLATVQMPVYALDSLRIWPHAQRVELIHNYVSRRGVDSFVRRQLVTVTQIRQRGEQIAGLVQKMQEAAAASSADDVPANRKSCHTWSGCPFQSRCSAFKEKPKMNLDPDEAEWLQVLGGGETKPNGPVGEPASLPEFLKEKPVTSGPEADRITELEIASAAGALDPSDDPFAVFAPVASVPQEQSPVCKDCGTELNAENGSQRDGKWKHIGCPKNDTPIVPSCVGDSSKCPDCPHPAHTGAACTGKRGRGACRCGAQSAVEKSQDVAAPAGGHLPVCVQDDAGKWLCMEGCTATKTGDAVAGGGGELAAAAYQRANPQPAKGSDSPPPGVADAVALHQSQDPAWTRLHADLTRERDMHRRTLGELEASERGLKAARAELERLRAAEPLHGEAYWRGRSDAPGGSTGAPPAGWTGTLQVNMNLGPETLALLQRLLGAKS